MVLRAAQILSMILGLTGSLALAQRMGGGGRGGGQPASPQSAEERQRAANAKEWADDIEKLRAQAPGRARRLPGLIVDTLWKRRRMEKGR
jgi:hypothetical protein